MRVFGVPEVFVTDPGREFRVASAKWLRLREQPSCKLTLGRLGGTAERNAQETSGNDNLSWRAKQKDLYRTLNMRLWPATVARFATGVANRSGFSPAQRVFRVSQRALPYLFRVDIVDPSYLYGDPVEDFERAEEFCQASWAALGGARQRLAVERERENTKRKRRKREKKNEN